MGASEQAIDLLGHMMVFNPLRRYTTNAALDHPYFQEEEEVLILFISLKRFLFNIIFCSPKWWKKMPKF